MAGNKNSNQKWIGVVIALQIVTVLGQWVSTPQATPAIAQVPDAGLQRIQMIEQAKGTNDRLDKLIALLSSGKLQVTLAKPDETKGQ